MLALSSWSWSLALNYAAAFGRSLACLETGFFENAFVKMEEGTELSLL